MAIQAAQRLALLRPSPIRILSEGAPPDAIPLGLGEPTWELPVQAREALAKVKGACAYGPNMGLPELRRALATFHHVTPDEVMVTVGSEEALLSLFLAYADPGDQVLIPDPGYPAYAALARLVGAEPVAFPLPAAQRFRLDPEAFRAALDQAPRARLAVINGPSNPTGGAWSKDALAAVASICETRGVLLISDEVYRELHVGERPPSLRDVTSSGVVVSSVSKAWGAAGLRVGWMLAEPSLLAHARTVHGFAVTCAAAPAQAAATALIEASDVILPATRAEVRMRWDALAEALGVELGQTPPPPDGAFYHWMPLPSWALGDPMAACLRMRDEAKVVVVPGGTFGAVGVGHLRISYAAFPEQLREGIRRLARYFQEGFPHA